MCTAVCTNAQCAELDTHAACIHGCACKAALHKLRLAGADAVLLLPVRSRSRCCCAPLARNGTCRALRDIQREQPSVTGQQVILMYIDLTSFK